MPYVFTTIALTVFGQLIIKWRVLEHGSLPTAFASQVNYLAKLIIDPFIILGLLSAFIASLSWMIAMSKLELSYAYPFTVLSLVFVFVLSWLIFNETMTSFKIAGMSIIVLGIFIFSR